MTMFYVFLASPRALSYLTFLRSQLCSAKTKLRLAVVLLSVVLREVFFAKSIAGGARRHRRRRSMHACYYYYYYYYYNLGKLHT